jgi:hypothetical protein
MQHDTNIDSFIGFLLELSLKDKKYFGEVTIKFNNGRVIEVHNKQSHKPPPRKYVELTK